MSNETANITVEDATPFRPDVVLPPGTSLRFMLEDLEMSQVELAEKMGLSKKHVNEIIQGKMPITDKTASALEKVLHVNAEYWLRAEGDYRAHLQREEEEEEFVTHWDNINEQFPIPQLISRGILPRTHDAYDKIVALLRFFRVAGPEQLTLCIEGLSGAKYRKAANMESKPGALLTWLQLCEIKCEKIQTDAFNESVFRDRLVKVRELTRERSPQEFIPKLQAQLTDAGVCVVFVEELKGARISGATKWLSPDKAMIGLSVRYKREDSLWFSFYHECAHILKHSKKQTFIDTPGSQENDAEEREADMFAADILIPPVEFSKFKTTSQFTESDIKQFADAIGISPGIVVGRLQYDKLIPYNSPLTKLKTHYAWVK